MFDPTVFENLKVVMEGELYDHDLEGSIMITDRKDLIDLAKIERSFSLSFRDKFCFTTDATFRLDVDCNNLSAELLEKQSVVPGCSVSIFFERLISDESMCHAVEEVLIPIWGDHQIDQKLISYFKGNHSQYINQISITFKKKITEEHIDDLRTMIPFILQTLSLLNELKNV